LFAFNDFEFLQLGEDWANDELLHIMNRHRQRAVISSNEEIEDNHRWGCRFLHLAPGQHSENVFSVF
jgi:hypothetical protein